MVTTVTPEEFAALLDDGTDVALVDTRDAESFAGWHVAGAVNYRYVPEDDLDVEAFRRETGIDPEDTVATMCAKGKSSHELAEDLDAAGYEDVLYVDGGMRGWSSVYHRVTVSLAAGAGDVEVVQIQRRAKGCLGYLVVGDGAAAAVDVTRHGEEWRAAAAERNAGITAVLDTHVHADHLSGGRALADELGVPYYLPAAAAERDVAYEFEPLARNETLDVGGVDVKALATPGHTDDMVSYLVGRSAVLTGDTLFTDSVGRTELQFAAGGDDAQGADGVADAEDDAESAGAATGADRLYDSLHGTLLAEPDGVVVCPGHFAVANDGTTGDVVPGEPVTTTVGAARREIDVLAADREAFVDRITATLPEKPPNYEDVIAANRGVSSPPDEVSAIELELGPNRCAAEANPESVADD